MACTCELCKFGKKVRRTALNGSHQQKNKLIDELMNRLCNAEADLDYEKCVTNGSWEVSVDNLETRLREAQSKVQTLQKTLEEKILKTLTT